MTAVITPMNIIRNERFIRISSIVVASAPIQAHVPGKGIATKLNNPQNLPLLILPLFLFVLDDFYTCEEVLKYFFKIPT